MLPGGGRYVGQVDDQDWQHGQGVEYRADGSEKFSGQWREGRMHGRGKRIFSNGDHYEGEYIKGMYNGLGAFTWADGHSYEGEFREDDLDGFGIEWTAAGKVVRCGRWAEDRLASSCDVPRSKIPVGKFLSAVGE